ncbi:MAG TPA: IS4 family transposase [Pirellulales bacterium]
MIPSNLIDAVETIKRSVAQCLTATSIEQACRAEGHRWRRRELDPAKTIQAFIVQVLHGNTACAHTVRLAHLNCSAEAYCQARARLPLSVYQRLLDETSQAARRSCRLPVWHGHRTFLVDGSSFSMPDTSELQASFGQPGGQRSGCGFPAAHWLTMFDARSGLLVKQLAMPLRTHDLSRVAELHPELRAGDVLVGDVAFASYAHLALLSRRKLHGVFRIHQRQLVSFRKDRLLVGKQPKGTVARRATGRLIRKLGKYDQLVEYTKPGLRPAWISAEDYAQLPDTLVVREVRYHTKLRGGRTRIVTLVTTLLDPLVYPVEDLAALYGQRWRVETNLSHLKTTMGMDVLHCQSVAGVLKEMAVYAIVYNLVRLVMIKAAGWQRTSVHSVSFVDALRWLALGCQTLVPLQLTVHPRRPQRVEPRVRKRRPKPFPLMRRPRRQLRQQLLRNTVAA